MAKKNSYKCVLQFFETLPYSLLSGLEMVGINYQ